MRFLVYIELGIKMRRQQTFPTARQALKFAHRKMVHEKEKVRLAKPTFVESIWNGLQLEHRQFNCTDWIVRWGSAIRQPMTIDQMKDMAEKYV